MIWKTEHLTENSKNIPSHIQKLVNQKRNHHLKDDPSFFSIGIVGGGPKGMYALEELFREINQANLKQKIKVYWWNESSYFGCGPNYQTDQPDFLLINYCIGHIDAWDRSNNDSETELNFVKWLNENKALKDHVENTDYASRSLVGYYLQDTLLQIIRNKPSSVDLILLNSKVKNVVTTDSSELKIITSDEVIQVDNLLLSTGHCYQNKPLIQFENIVLSLNYLNNAYPIERLNVIQPEDKVGIIGWGLTFIDVAIALTEGRGGFFDSNGTYQKSGKEPILYPFSRNQLPIMPRGPIYGENAYNLRYIDDNLLNQLQLIAVHRKIDFYKEVLPILEKELKFAYYSRFLKTEDELTIETYIDSLSDEDLFSFNSLLFPKIPKGLDVQDSYIKYLDFLIEEAEKGELKSPLMAAASVWREASPFIAKIYQFGGFTGKSQKYLDQHLFGAFCRTSYGPPIENMKKIGALLKAGIIQTPWMNSIEINYLNENERFILKNSEYQEEVDFIIDARIARPQIEQNNAELYQNLYLQNSIEPFNNEDYLPGCVWINESGKVKNEKDIQLYFYGSNTEGILLDNDSLSRRKNNFAPKWVQNVMHQMISK